MVVNMILELIQIMEKRGGWKMSKFSCGIVEERLKANDCSVYVGGGNMDDETSVDWRARSHGSLEEAFDKVLYHDSLYSLS